ELFGLKMGADDFITKPFSKGGAGWTGPQPSTFPTATRVFSDAQRTLRHFELLHNLILKSMQIQIMQERAAPLGAQAASRKRYP
ncbi:hypothetical protein AB9F45_37570, partial [Rhizobium leguminosarum]|uniref:hypothetical protein n=1 Tax=Rhizobium leguminosarum TaxID=384 RepID=UPI003F9B6703